MVLSFVLISVLQYIFEQSHMYVPMCVYIFVLIRQFNN